MNALRAALILLLLSPGALADARDTALDLNERALEAIRRGEFDEAIRLLGEARRYLPVDETLRKNLAAVHARRGLARAKAGQNDTALKDFRWAVYYDPDRHTYRVNLALTLIARDEFFEAKKELETVLARAPRNPDAQEQYGRLLYREGELAGAIRAFKVVLEVSPERSRVRTALAKALRDQEVESSMTRDTGAHFAITFDGEKNDRIARDVMDLLEDTYSAIGYELRHYPRERVQVILYTKEQFRAATEARSWVGGLYDGKIRLPVRGLQGSEDRLRRTVVHEYVHVVVRDLAARCPIWINEGIAQLFEGRTVGSSDRRAMSAERAGRLLSLKALSRPFATISDADQAALAYAQSHSMVAWLARNRGTRSFGDFLQAMKRGKSPAVAFEHAFRNTMEEVLSHWREEIHQKAQEMSGRR